MDVQDHKKTPSSAGGHEGQGVHVCHKCGWPFPNPHPSAKHRRAHKRVCGKVEGYKLVDSETDHVSDDDHLSDDDIVKTPSPKMEKGSVKEVGSGAGIGLKSSKSEDDVFSDAVTEFSDSGISPSPSIEERLESVREVHKTVGAELVHELNDNLKSEDCLADGRKISNAEVVVSVINQSENTKPASDNRVEEVSFGVEQTDGLPINSSPSVFETISEDTVANAESGKQKEIISSKSETNIQVKESVNEVESSTECAVLLSKSPDEAPLSKSKSDMAEGSSGPVVVESMVPEADRKVSDTMTMEPKLHEADGSISHAAAVRKIVEQEKEPSNKLEAGMTSVSTVDEIIEQEKGLSNVLHAEMTKLDLPSQTEPHKCADTSVTTQAEADSAGDAIGVGHDELARVCDLKEGGDKEVHVVSVADALPAVENPEIMIGDFKDYNVLSSSFPVDLGDAEVTRSGEDDNKVNLSEPVLSPKVTVDEIIEQEKGLSNVLQAEMTILDLPSQTEPHKCADTSVTTQAEADSAGDAIGVGHDELAKVCDLKEGGDKEVHVVSVAEALPAVENPEIMIGDFKDYKVLRSGFPVDLGDAEVTRSGEDDNKVNLSEPVSSPSSSVPVGSLHTTNLNSSCSEASLEKGGLLTPVQGEVDTSGLRGVSEEGSGSNGLEGSSVVSGFEKQVIEGCKPKSTDKESSQDGVSAPSSIEHSDVMRAVLSIGEETSSQTTNLSNSVTTDDNVNLKGDHVRTENGTNHPLDEDNISSSKKCTIEVDVETSQGTEIGKSTEGQGSEGVFVVDPDVIPEVHSVASGEQSANPKEMETQISSSDSQLKPEDHGGASDKKSEDSEEAAALPVASTISSQSSATVEDRITDDAVTSEIGKSTEVQRSEDVFVVDPDLSPEGCSVASGEQSEDPKEMETQSSSSVSQLKPEDHGGASDKKSEDYKEAAALPVAPTISNQSSATVEDKITNDVVASEPLLDGDNGKLTKESVYVSAVDDCVVSSSRTESLNGNWGSVSVLSAQSDGTALADAETLSSAGNQGPEKSGGTSSKLQTSSQDSHTNKSDAFEPPSFMTLVESRVGDDKKVVATETHNIQKTEQPNSEALQAGWFPSLTNVVNESEGRKKNEEIIAKVTNWNAGKQHSPLKSLLNEAQAETKVKSAEQKQVPSVNQGNETVSKNNGAAVTTVSSIMGSETPVDNAAKRDMEKEWNSPARYPVEIKKEKKKGKPYWVPFVCCTSIFQDM